MSAPKPANFDEMCRAWNDPAAYARELHRYYEQLAVNDPVTRPRDVTEPIRGRDQE